jgi:hypothetical protein
VLPAPCDARARLGNGRTCPRGHAPGVVCGGVADGWPSVQA